MRTAKDDPWPNWTILLHLPRRFRPMDRHDEFVPASQLCRHALGAPQMRGGGSFARRRPGGASGCSFRAITPRCAGTTTRCIICHRPSGSSEPVPLLKALGRWRRKIKLIGIEACPLAEWLYGALVEGKLETICIETRHTQRFLSSRPNRTDRSDARGIADMRRLGHFKLVHVKSRLPQLVRTTLLSRSAQK
jgi:hypothetical protein